MAKRVLLLTYPRTASAEDIEVARLQAQGVATACDAMILVLPEGFRLTDAGADERIRALGQATAERWSELGPGHRRAVLELLRAQTETFVGADRAASVLESIADLARLTEGSS